MKLADGIAGNAWTASSIAEQRDEVTQLLESMQHAGAAARGDGRAGRDGATA